MQVTCSDSRTETASRIVNKPRLSGVAIAIPRAGGWHGAGAGGRGAETQEWGPKGPERLVEVVSRGSDSLAPLRPAPLQHELKPTCGCTLSSHELSIIKPSSASCRLLVLQLDLLEQHLLHLATSGATQLQNIHPSQNLSSPLCAFLGLL